MTELVEAKNESENDLVQRLSVSLDGWRGRIDELLVQFDLAEHEVRDQVRKHIDITENVYLAARSRLAEVQSDAHSSVKALCAGTEELIRDLQKVYDAAEDALRRGRTE